MVCRNYYSKIVKKKQKVNKLTSIFLLMTIISVAGIMYIVQVNRLATMGYEIMSKEEKIKDLDRENELLKIRATELKSMHNLEADKKEMRMKKPEEISYVEVGNPVASR